MKKYQCQNCNHTGPQAGFPAAQDINQRIEPGELYTDRECPKCGALAHPLAGGRQIALATEGEASHLGQSIEALKNARDHAVMAGSPKLIAKIRRALKSADGARRHMDHRLRRTGCLV